MIEEKKLADRPDKSGTLYDGDVVPSRPVRGQASLELP